MMLLNASLWGGGEVGGSIARCVGIARILYSNAYQWLIQDFPKEITNSKVGSVNLLLSKVLQKKTKKTAWNWKCVDSFINLSNWWRSSWLTSTIGWLAVQDGPGVPFVTSPRTTQRWLYASEIDPPRLFCLCDIKLLSQMTFAISSFGDYTFKDPFTLIVNDWFGTWGASDFGSDLLHLLTNLSSLIRAILLATSQHYADVQCKRTRKMTFITCKSPFTPSKSECESKKMIKEPMKEIKEKFQTSRKIFPFVFAFARCEWALRCTLFVFSVWCTTMLRYPGMRSRVRLVTWWRTNRTGSTTTCAPATRSAPSGNRTARSTYSGGSRISQTGGRISKEGGHQSIVWLKFSWKLHAIEKKLDQEWASVPGTLIRLRPKRARQHCFAKEITLWNVKSTRKTNWSWNQEKNLSVLPRVQNIVYLGD